MLHQMLVQITHHLNNPFAFAQALSSHATHFPLNTVKNSFVLMFPQRIINSHWLQSYRFTPPTLHPINPMVYLLYAECELIILPELQTDPLIMPSKVSCSLQMRGNRFWPALTVRQLSQFNPKWYFFSSSLHCILDNSCNRATLIPQAFYFATYQYLLIIAPLTIHLLSAFLFETNKWTYPPYKDQSCRFVGCSRSCIPYM